MRKGQTITEEQKKKHRETRLKNLRSKYNWNLVKDFLDTEIDLGSRNKIHPHIRLREFKTLVENGMDLKTLSKMYGKSFIQFCSIFSQGKINLTKEDFIKDYETGMSLEEISSKYNICIDYIGFVRQIYGIKNKGATFIHRKKTETPLTQRQKEIAYGSLIGDAKRTSPSSMGFGHSEKQKDYLMWKWEEMKNLCSEKSFIRYVSFDKRYNNKENVGYRFYTHANTDIENIIRQCYIPNKEITKEYLENITPLSLAVWYQDDGVVGFRIDNINGDPIFRICTDSFSLKSCQNIQEMFLKKFNIKTSVIFRQMSKDGKRKMYRILIEKESHNDFIDLIKPHFVSSMLYKIDKAEYIMWRAKKDGCVDSSLDTEDNDEDNEDFDIINEYMSSREKAI